MIRQHCTFVWRQPESGYQRTVEVEPQHCPACVAELERQPGFVLHHPRKKSSRSAAD